MTERIEMLDDGPDEEVNDHKNVVIVISERSTLIKNVLTVPKDEALRMAASIIVQVDLL